MRIRIVLSIAMVASPLLLVPSELEAKNSKGGRGSQPSQPPPQAQTPKARTTRQPPEKPPEQEIFDSSEPLDEGNSESSAKSAVPSDDAQQASMKTVKEVYGDDYNDAKTPDQKRDLAQIRMVLLSI